MLDPWALRRSRWKKRIAARLFEDAHLRSAACIRATAHMEAEHVRAYGLRQPIAVVPNGIEIPDISVGRDEPVGYRRIVFLSRIHPKKGIAYLLRSWARLQHSYPDWELVVAGPDEVGHQDAMQALASDLRLERVSWPGPAYGDEREKLYRSADLFVLPTHGENFGLVVAEALAHGVPVITTRHAPWAGLETFGCGWWVELSEGSLTEALSAAMKLPDDERATMGMRGRRWMARDFSWGMIGKSMVDVYEWVLGGGPPPSTVITD
jgi:glycosyltransferase involved in cell wall biosynthesis